MNEISPHWGKENLSVEDIIGKTTFIKKKNNWKVFWLRADLQCHCYPPKPIVKTVKSLLNLWKKIKIAVFGFDLVDIPACQNNFKYHEITLDNSPHALLIYKQYFLGAKNKPMLI